MTERRTRILPIPKDCKLVEKIKTVYKFFSEGYKDYKKARRK